jgi:hypothetical protein
LGPLIKYHQSAGWSERGINYHRLPSVHRTRPPSPLSSDSSHTKTLPLLSCSLSWGRSRRRMRGRIFNRTASKTLCASATSRISGYESDRADGENKRARNLRRAGWVT